MEVGDRAGVLAQVLFGEVGAVEEGFFGFAGGSLYGEGF